MTPCIKVNDKVLLLLLLVGVERPYIFMDEGWVFPTFFSFFHSLDIFSIGRGHFLFTLPEDRGLLYMHSPHTDFSLGHGGEGAMGAVA